MKISNPNSHRFSFCPDCGKETLAPDNEKSFLCSACGFLLFINCAAAAMAIILDEKNRVLVTRRKRDPAQNSLDLPGGFAEPGEGIEACLTREIKEELNLEVIALTYLCSFPNAYPYKSVVYPVTDMAFVCHVKDFDHIKAMDDVADFSFMPVSRLIPENFGMASARKTIEYIKTDLSVLPGASGP